MLVYKSYCSVENSFSRDPGLCGNEQDWGDLKQKYAPYHDWLHNTSVLVCVCVCSTSQSCTCPCDIRCSEWEREVSQGLFLFLFVARWECGSVLPDFWLLKRSLKYFLKCKLPQLLHIGSNLKKCIRFASVSSLVRGSPVCNPLVLWSVWWRPFRGFFFIYLNSVLCSEYFSVLINNSSTQHFLSCHGLSAV